MGHTIICSPILFEVAMNKVYVSIILSLLVGCSSDVNTTAYKFNRICDSFEVLSKDDKLAELSAEERDLYIFNDISDLKADSVARTAWIYARYVVPVEERYAMFKAAVDSVENGDWSCLAMKELAPLRHCICEEENANDIKLPEPTMLEDADF